jgi:hypothetical protein
MKEQECSNCQYYIGGLCKYNPPPQPTVAEDDWCSHWCAGPIPEAPVPERVDSAGDVE